MVVVSVGYVDDTGGSGKMFSAADVLEMSVVRGMRGVGGVCGICMCLARSGVGGEGVSEMDFGFSNRVGIRGVLDVYLCLGCGGVGGEWVGAGNRFWRVGWWYVCASYESELFM